MTLRTNIDSIAMGIIYVCPAVKLTGIAASSGLPYYLILLSLNILLTLMIVIRLIVHARITRAALGTTRIGGLYKAVITMLVESCAIFTVSSLLVIGSLDALSPIADFFLPILHQTQVRAIPRLRYSDRLADVRWIGQVITPLLVIRRVVNKDTLTSNAVAPVHLSLFKARSHGESTTGSGTLPARDVTISVDRCGVAPGRLGVGTTTDSH